MSRRPLAARMSPDDPAFVALQKIAEALGPFERAQQLRILAATCLLAGEYGYARAFLSSLEREELDDANAGVRRG